MVGSTALYCDVEGVSERLPIQSVSSGTHKLICYLLGMASHPRGVVLIDEIENGIYYAKMAEVWKAIFEFSKELGVQIFASTHSKECLDSLLEILPSNPKQFRLIRMERREGKSVASVFKGNEFESALETGTEFR